MSVFWQMELDLASLESNAVFIVSFVVSMGLVWL